jgi:diadenosine tetraphosphatase ApaH/serine/threonine PP2A family protein phosphatase
VSIDDRVEICHGSPFDEDHYIFDAEDAARALDTASRPLCLFGHTHLPVIFRRDPSAFDGFMPDGGEATTLPIAAGTAYLVNIGSVGQPRDGDPRAAFGIYESEGPSLLLRRAVYPVAEAQRRILNAGLPSSLANRLGVGR